MSSAKQLAVSGGFGGELVGGSGGGGVGSGGGCNINDSHTHTILQFISMFNSLSSFRLAAPFRKLEYT